MKPDTIYHFKKIPVYLSLITILFFQTIELRAIISQDEDTVVAKVYVFDIKEEIAAPVWRKTQLAFQKANEQHSNLILIHMNTYGGLVDVADSIRTKILNSTIPVYVFIDNNAASAGALISIACDSIYMVPGASIGAATVVNQTGEVVPDKFQSYMRSMMRSTAEATGRDPKIAQAMVDPSMYVAGVSDSGKVLTFTTSEAIRHQFCNGKAHSIREVLRISGHANVEITYQELNLLDWLIDFLIHPAVSSILIIVIIGGIYFEIQSPGIGFPILVAIIAALLYFAPLYLEGLALNWEILIFVIGIILLLIEIFAIPGFGVIGIFGLVFIIGGLTFAMLENVEGKPFSIEMVPFIKSFFTVIIAILVALIGSIYLSKKLFSSTSFGQFALNSVQDKKEGFTSATEGYTQMIGKKGRVKSMLRPSGKIEIDGEIFDATAVSGFIDKDEAIEVIKYQTGQLFVRKSKQ
ncbi:MAG: nodulation protein NfeD [Bacteroidales bacterium]|nr:nodulation protein NfeD [Bacteroidales bacterium]